MREGQTEAGLRQLRCGRVKLDAKRPVRFTGIGGRQGARAENRIESTLAAPRSIHPLTIRKSVAVALLGDLIERFGSGASAPASKFMLLPGGIAEISLKAFKFAHCGV